MYYPEQRIATQMARIKRRAVLPEATLGSVRVKQGQVVDMRDTVARGLYPARYIVVDAVEELGLRGPEQVPEMLFVDLNTPIPRNTVIAGRDMERGKRIIPPFDVIVVSVTEDGRIIMQEVPDVINLEAGVRGQVKAIHGNRGVTIEATGGVVQGVWGNDREEIATLRFEPEQGLENVEEDSDLDAGFRGEILVSKRPLTRQLLQAARRRAVAGIIAPSMNADLLDIAMKMSFPVMLTAGFGQFSMRRDTFAILEHYEGYQGVLDASLPQRFDNRRPELIIHQPARSDMPEFGEKTRLRVGMTVRITRDPWLGMFGKVVELPPDPVLLPNGLRVKAALIEINLSEKVAVPLANIELAGG